MINIPHFIYNCKYIIYEGSTRNTNLTSFWIIKCEGIWTGNVKMYVTYIVWGLNWLNSNVNVKHLCEMLIVILVWIIYIARSSLSTYINKVVPNEALIKL